jgi:hypothetical protein
MQSAAEEARGDGGARIDVEQGVGVLAGETDAAAVDAAVERFMRDHNINSPFLPDCVERRLYRNAIHLALTVARGALDGCRVRMFGHVLSLSLRPEAVDGGEDDGAV